MSSEALRDSTVSLASANVGALRDWLRSGILRMSGVVSDDQDAFAPYASFIGHAPDRTWLDELADFIVLQEQQVSDRLKEAINGVVDSLVRNVADDNWLAIQAALELQQMVAPRGRLVSLKTVAFELANTKPGLAASRRARLAATALMSATEASGDEFNRIGSVAIPLAKLVVALAPPKTDAQRQALRLRLSRIHASPEQLQDLGIAAEPAELAREVRHRASLGMRSASPVTS